MAALLETIGSFVLAMMITLSVLRLQFDASAGDAQAKATYNLQIFAENLRRDLRSTIGKVGYDVDDKTTVVTTCTASNFVFKTDLNGDKWTETNSITVTSLPASTTPRLTGDQRIRVTLGGKTTVISCPGLCDFKMVYYDKNMSVTSTPANVRLVEYSFRVSSTEPIDLKKVGGVDTPVYAQAWAQDRVFLKNIFVKY